MGEGQRVGTVAVISRYPVKSMQGETVQSGTITTSGLDGDRGWGIIDTATGQVLTAKRVAQLLDAHARSNAQGPSIELPDGTVLAEPGPTADAVLSEWLGRPVALRPAPEEGAKFKMSFNVEDEDVDAFEWSTPQGSFVDLSAVHVLTTAALAAAADGGPGSDWNVHRFRPTILIESDPAETGFVENDWVGSSISFGDVVLDVTMPTIRCALPTKAQSPHSIERDLEIFKSLTANNGQNLGAYTSVRTPGAFKVGDSVELT